MWKIVYTEKGAKTFGKLGHAVQERIDKRLNWLAENFEHIRPDGLSGKLAGTYKLQAGDYRVIYDFDRDKQLIYVLKAGHRSDIYEE